MGMPNHALFVRHGESEGNIAVRLSKKGDDRWFTPEFRNRHSSSWRLTDRGIVQSQAAGKWLRREFSGGFNRLYSSVYIRALETAVNLELPEKTVWYPDIFLSERDWGELDCVTQQEKLELYARSMEMKETDPFHWNPPNGESMRLLCSRLKWHLDTLHRECDGLTTVAVCHGEVMWGIRVMLERIAPWRYLELDKAKPEGIRNCQILHYTRLNPETGEQAKYLGWMRSICPWDEQLSTNWRPVDRPKYTVRDLRQIVECVPRLVEG